MTEKICTKCKKADGPFRGKQSWCNPCLANSQRDYVSKQDPAKYADKQRKHDSSYRRRNKLKGIKRVSKQPPGYAKSRWAALRNSILLKYGNKCAKCEFSDVRALQIDHVLGGGSKDRREQSSNHTYYKKILEDETGKFQLLCANCNWIKRSENGEDL